MAETQIPRTELSDAEYLRHKSTPELRSLLRRTERSVRELSEYVTVIRQVLGERE